MTETHAIIEKEEEPPEQEVLSLGASFLNLHWGKFRDFCASKCKAEAAIELVQWLEADR